MKTKIYFFLAFFTILMACKKEPTEEDNFNRLKSAHEEIKMELSFTVVPDWTVPQINCTPEISQVKLPGKEWVHGTVTYMGPVNELSSYAVNTSCEVIDATHIREAFEGVITSENGEDDFYYSGRGLIDLTNVSSRQSASITGEITINDGNGKFENVKGTITISGTLDFSTGSIEWKSEDGFIYFE